MRLGSGHELVACTAGKMRKHHIRIIAGDSVSLEPSPYAVSKGRIMFRHPNRSSAAPAPRLSTAEPTQDPHRPASGLDAPDLVALAKRKGFTPTRCQALSHELPAAVDSMWRRNAWEIPEGHLDDYVKLGWMDRNSGALVLTSSGRAVHNMVVAQWDRKMKSGEQALPNGQRTVQRAAVERPATGDDSPLPPGERAELQRQGAKSAARGEPGSRNPLLKPVNLPQATGESQQTWLQRSEAWQRGHEAQSRASHHATANPDKESR